LSHPAPTTMTVERAPRDTQTGTPRATARRRGLSVAGPALVVALVLPIKAADAGSLGGAAPAFDSYALNAPWYGAYHRPLAEVRDGGERDAREARAERRPSDAATDRAARREERATLTAARRSAGNTDHSRSAGATRGAEHAPPPPSSARRVGYPVFDAALAAAYVRDVYALNETPIGDGSTRQVVDVYRFAQQRGTIYHNPRPAVGDLAFFHNTEDANGDGRNNDWFTHVGIVESVDAEGTVTILSFVDGRIDRFVMNREREGVARDGDRTLNAALRAPGRGDVPPDTYLASTLFAGFGALLGDRPHVTVLDQWNPDQSPSLRASR